jgi:signal transduction histidine kinase
LGLSIAQWIIQRHRGTISVRSSPGHGAEFSVELPSPAIGATVLESPSRLREPLQPTNI